MNQTQLVQSVVEEVIKRLGVETPAAPISPITGAGPAVGGFGIYSCVDRAVDAAEKSYLELMDKGIEVRRGICDLLKKIAVENADAWGQIEFDETQVGRVDHKIGKLHLIPTVPGVEFLETPAHTGDDGVGFDFGAPFGVIGCITPVTHSIPTLTANAINMIASGNALIINAHPSGYKCACMAVEVYNKAIHEAYGISDLITIINPPTIESANAIFSHRKVPVLVVTGGPAVARAALAQKKRAIVAGPGNPPVVVDETADLDRAARSIIAGAGFDNNLLCIGEKQVFVVDSVFDKMMEAMARAGAVQLNSQQVATLTEKAIKWVDDHYVANKEFVGKDTTVLAAAAGANHVTRRVDLLYGETTIDNPFVPCEQMMPFVPFVRVPDVDAAIAAAMDSEHGFGHTACMHSNNLAAITKMGRLMNTTIFAVNGPSTAGLGIGGEGYPSFSIATPTGEGITNPRTFTRFRRMTVSESLNIIGA